MTDKKSFWSKDLFDPFEGEEYRNVDYLTDVLNIVKNIHSYSVSPPPAEVVFALVKEVLLYARFFFGFEHRDILARNPSLKIVYRKTLFKGPEGYREIDTGLPESIRHSRRILLRNEPFVEDYFGDVLQDLIELEQSYLKDRLDTFFNERRSTVKGPGRTLVQSQKSFRRKADSRFFYLRRQLRAARQSPGIKSFSKKQK
jgi:hypothetical protein